MHVGRRSAALVIALALLSMPVASAADQTSPPIFAYSRFIPWLESKPRIWTARLDGSDAQPVPGAFGILPALAADGRIAYVAFDGNCASGSSLRIWLHEGGTNTCRTQGNSVEWLPGGESLVISADAPGGEHLFRFDLATSERTQLTSGSGFHFDPEPIGDGSRIAFSRFSNGETTLHLLDVPSGVVTEISHPGYAFLLEPSWTGTALQLLAITEDQTRSILFLDLETNTIEPGWLIHGFDNGHDACDNGTKTGVVLASSDDDGDRIDWWDPDDGILKLIEAPMVTNPSCAPVPSDADLAVEVSGPKAVPVGTIAQYRGSLTNNGPDRVEQDVLLHLRLPGVDRARVIELRTDPQGDCSIAPDEQVATCNLGAMAAGETVSFFVELLPIGDDWLSIQATALPVDRRSSNNVKSILTRSYPASEAPFLLPSGNTALCTASLKLVSVRFRFHADEGERRTLTMRGESSATVLHPPVAPFEFAATGSEGEEILVDRTVHTGLMNGARGRDFIYVGGIAIPGPDGLAGVVSDRHSDDLTCRSGHEFRKLVLYSSWQAGAGQYDLLFRWDIQEVPAG